MNDEQQKMHEESESFATLLEQSEVAGTRLEKGQKVTGTIIEITADNVFVNVGDKNDGVMDRKDFVNAKGEDTAKLGDVVEAWVVGKDSHGIRLSRSMSGSGLAALEDACSSRIPVEGRVTATCKGGFTVDVLGKRAFCPGSQMDVYGEAEDVVGRTLQFLILKIENHGRNIVVSHRQIADLERAENLEKMLAQIHEGDIVEGRVVRLTPFGAFVEIGPGVEGLVHISELSWSRVDDPKEVVAVDSTIKVKVIGIKQDEKGTKIALSRKQADGNPWETVQDHIDRGAVLEGKVRRLMPFGAFVEILPGIEGMVHVSEMAWGRRVNKPEEVVSVGDSVRVKVLDIDPETKRISLSIRDAEGDPWADAQEKYAVGTKVEGTVESQSNFGIFVQLCPGITGLLPSGAMKGKNQADLLALKPGDPITVIVQRLDLTGKKISLLPEGASVHEQGSRDDHEWKKHARSGQTNDLGQLGLALQKALKNKK